MKNKDILLGICCGRCFKLFEEKHYSPTLCMECWNILPQFKRKGYKRKREKESDRIRIGKIGNDYGELYVKKENRKFYFLIDGYDDRGCEEITETLYNELLKHNNLTNNIN